MENMYNESPFSITLKVSAKNEVYGEFTVRAATYEELVARFNSAKTLLVQNMGV
jgi:hypothetical protein